MTSARRHSVWLAPLLVAVTPLVVHLLLFRARVPLGCPGRFVYLYSPVVSWRMAAVPTAILLAVIPALGVWLSTAVERRWRRVGLVLVGVGGVALAAWSYVAPPDYRNQHVFNVFSPSQDGAFVVEGLRVDNVGAYLREFAQRATTPPAEMRGTRVVSNPPGTTLLVVGIERLLRAYPGLGRLVPLGDDAELAAIRGAAPLEHAARVGLLFFWALTGLWVLAGVFFYLAGRIFLDPPWAATFALCSVFSPMTLLFTPGKDPAQLLILAALLYFWLLAWRRGHVVLAAAGGLVLVGACLVSLVYVWVAGIVAGATLLAVVRDRAELRRVLLRVFLPACAGVLAGCGLLALVGVDVPAIALAVAGAQRAVTRGPQAMPLAWQLLGVPLFLLLAGPAWWLAGASAKVRVRSFLEFGGALLLLTILVLLVTVGFTNVETPRLWIPFVPLMLLGGILRFTAAGEARPTLVGGAHPTDAVANRRRAIALAALVFVQIAVAATQWSLMDPRETETRLVDQRFFG